MDYTRDALMIQELAEEKLEAAGNFSGEVFLQNIFDLYNGTGGNWTGDGEGVGGRGRNETDWVPYSQRPETYIVPVLFAIIFIIGVLGNGTLIRIFIEHRQMRNVPNMYICSLAVGDLLVILFCVPFTSTVYTVESWPYGLLVCKFSEFIKDVSIGVSVFTLTALSADRYFAIVDPMRKLLGRRATRITCFTIAGIWIASLVIALPSLLYSFIRKFEHENREFLICYPYPPEFGPSYPKLVVMLKFLMYYAVPLGFIASFYIIMARHLVLSTKNMPGEAQGQAKQNQGRKKVAKMVLSFVVIFALCFFPSHLFFLWFYFYPDAEYHFNDFWNIVRILGFCLSFFNSCINPITLYCVSGTFRKYFNMHLFCCICPDDRATPEPGAAGIAVSMSITTNMCHDRVNPRPNGRRWNPTKDQLLPMSRLNNTHLPKATCNRAEYPPLRENLPRKSNQLSLTPVPPHGQRMHGRDMEQEISVTSFIQNANHSGREHDNLQ